MIQTHSLFYNSFCSSTYILNFFVFYCIILFLVRVVFFQINITSYDEDILILFGYLNVPQLNTSIFSENITGTKLASPITVNTNVTKLTDREIALSYFLTLKRAGKEYAIASMEATNPKLRQFLKDAYTMSCNHSYEVYQWMAKNNYSPIIMATGEQTGDISSLYNNIPL